MKKAHFESAAPAVVDHAQRFAMTAEAPKVREAEALVAAPPAGQPAAEPAEPAADAPPSAKGRRAKVVATAVAMLLWLTLGSQAWAQFATNAPVVNPSIGGGFDTTPPGSIALPGTQFNTNPPTSTGSGFVPGNYTYPLVNPDGYILWPPKLTGSLAGNASGLTNQIPGVYNIRDFGAVGQNAAKDSWGFTNAFSAAILSNGAVYIPPGNFYVTNSLNVRGQQAARVPIHGAGMDVSVVTFVGTNNTFLTNAGSVDLQDFSIVNGNAHLAGCTNYGMIVNSDSYPAYMKNVRFSFFEKGADLNGAAGCRIDGCSFNNNHIGLHMPGWCDGAEINARVDYNDVGVEIGGPGTKAERFQGHDALNGMNINVMGERNIYGVVVGQGHGPVRITGYMEECYRAIISLGHPPEFYYSYYGTNFYSFQTNKTRSRLECRIGYDGTLGFGGDYSALRSGGWYDGQTISGTLTNYCAIWMPSYDIVLSDNNCPTYSKNTYADASNIRFAYALGSFYKSDGTQILMSKNGSLPGANAEVNPTVRNEFSSAGNLLTSETQSDMIKNKRVALGAQDTALGEHAQFSIVSTNSYPFTIFAGGGSQGLPYYFSSQAEFSLVSPLYGMSGYNGLAVMEAVDAAPGKIPNVVPWGEAGGEYSSMVNFGAALLCNGYNGPGSGDSTYTVPPNVYSWWVNPVFNDHTIKWGVPAMVLYRNGSLHVGTNSPFLWNPMGNSLYVESNITAQASITCLGGVITNNGVCWISTNNTPRGTYPAGSIATASGGSAPGFYVQAVPGTWVGPK